MKKIRKKQQSSLIINIIFSVIALFALTVGIVFLLINYSLKEKMEAISNENNELRAYSESHIYTIEDLDKKAEEVRLEENDKEKQILLEDIKEVMNNGYSAYYLLRYLYPDDVVVNTSEGYEFFPILDSVKKNEYVIENFIEDEDSNEITYISDSTDIVARKGIDVSSFNGKINWEKVAADGIEFAFIRVGYRGSTEGALSLDTYFEENIKGAILNGIDVGVYFFTQATSKEEAVEEAVFVMDAIEPYEIKYPVAYDLEEYKGGRAEGLDREVYLECTKAFLDTVANSGYTPMLYGNLNTLFIMSDPEETQKYDKWFAYYAYPVYYPYEFAIWQYQSKGKVDGIKGEVDMNICLKAY